MRETAVPSIHRLLHAHILFVVGLTSAGCTFRPGFTAPTDADNPGDADVLDVLSAAPQWVTTSVSAGPIGTTELVVHPFDGTHFAAACAHVPAPDDVRVLFGHPTLPYVYAVESGLQGIALGCGAITPTNVGDLGGARPSPQIAMNASATIGFSTYDGPGPLAVFRFTAGPDGKPTVGGTANGPSVSGAVALDSAGNELFVAGTSSVSSYALVGAQLDLPTTSTPAPSCVQAVGLIVSGSRLLVFCSDTDQIQRYSRNPFTFDSAAGAIGTLDHVAALPNDRAVAARSTPPSLVMVEVAGGNPTWTDGPSVPSRVTAMAISTDGTMLVTARQVDATTSEIAMWKITGQAISLLDTQMVSNTVTAVAITTPGS